MTEPSDRVQCPNCGANNFPSSAVCWQCGRPLTTQSGSENQTPPPGPETPQTPPPGPPTPPITPPPSYTPPPPTRRSSTLIILGFVFAGLGIVLVPCCAFLSSAFSVAAIIMGAVSYSRGERLGTWVIIAGAISLVLGIILSAVLIRMLTPLIEQMQKQPFNP